MNISTILRSKGNDVVMVSADDTVGTVAKVLSEKKIGAVLVCTADGSMCGVISERDIVRGLGEQGPAVLDQAVSTMMTTEVIRCAPDDSVNSAMARMSDRRIRHLPVFEGDKLMGVISIGDVVKYRIQEIEAEANALREYITT